MIVLDTDHLTILGLKASDRQRQLAARLDAAASAEPVAITIISIEEQMRGWLSAVAKERTPQRQCKSYRGLASVLDWFRRFRIISFDEVAAEQFAQLRASKVRIGTMDLKIAAISLSTNSLLLTANERDFVKIPGLRFENWLTG